MKLENLVKPIDEMTDDELLIRLREIKHRREVVRPAAQKRIQVAEKKETKVRGTSINKLLQGLSQSEKEALMKQLSGE